MPGIAGSVGQLPVATRMCSAVNVSRPTATVCASTRRARPAIRCTPASSSSRAYTPFRRAISASLLRISVRQSCEGGGADQPKPAASSTSRRNADAYTSSFFGMQPTFTHVPPRSLSSAIATRAP